MLVVVAVVLVVLLVLLELAVVVMVEVVVLVLADMAPTHTLWGWSRLVLQRLPLRRIPGLRFSKVLGSGHNGGFGLRPSKTRQGLFLAFDDEASARSFIHSSAVMAGYRARSAELLVALLRACSSKGSWSGTQIGVTAATPTDGPIAALTRASIRPQRAAAFWRIQPGTEQALAKVSGCLLAAGVGEAPLLRQATFTLWESAAAMDAYARSGAHGEAIRTAYQGGFFAETMFVRFAPLLVQGRWQGVDHG
jgi:spheroidene monooxygenase